MRYYVYLGFLFSFLNSIMSEPSEKIYRSKKDIFINNFIGGVAWGLGASLGLAVLIAIIGYIISRIDWVPIMGSIVSEASNQVLQKNLQLIQ
jgi:hypothetical protein